MDQLNQHQESGSYTANLLGNIRSHLAGLQGYDVMALELIQNADDARAERIIFDITDKGLLVLNSGTFTYCGDLKNPCKYINSNEPVCDFHRIADVGSGGKLSQGENIGRFGIGFVSTYQVTDHPEIRSAGHKLTLYPELGKWFIEEYEEPYGTSFFLPWATDSNTKARLGLGISNINPSHIEQLVDDFKRVLQQSLLFLRHIRTAEVQQNGELLLACDLDRGEGCDDLIVRFRPSDEVEHWHILRTDTEDIARQLYAIHPRLEQLNRSTGISIGLRIEPEPLARGEGRLYAFLPTEQSAGLPFHINADFFPESDRKAVIFAGHQHEQAWNEMLIKAAAVELSRDLEGLLEVLGHLQFWHVIERAFDLRSKSPDHPECYRYFWENLSTVATEANIALAQDGSVQTPNGVFLPRNPLNTHQAGVFLEIGGRLASEDLRQFQVVMNQLGAPYLIFERLVSLLESAVGNQLVNTGEIDENELERFYLPLWGIIDDHLLDSVVNSPSSNPVAQRLSIIPFIVTEDLSLATINQSWALPTTWAWAADRIAILLPGFEIASHHLNEFGKVRTLINPLSLDAVVSHIVSMSASASIEEFINVDERHLRNLYSLFADLDRLGTAEEATYQQLSNLPIWRSGTEFIRATEAKIPGNFTDPTDQTNLLDMSVLSERAKEFVLRKLKVQELTIETYVRDMLPTIFNDYGPVDATKYTQLITELAKHPSLIDKEDIRMQLNSLPIIPSQDEGWSRPTDIYRRTSELVKVLGDSPRLWLDANRIPNARSVDTFIDNLGILRSPTARHLAARLQSIAKEWPPSEDAKQASSDTFYALCEKYKKQKDDQEFQDAIAYLQQATCFPADGDSERWYAANSLYAPYRADAFRSQANILHFKNSNRLEIDLLKKLGIATRPETQLIVDHLLYCAERGVQPHTWTYEILNERAQDHNEDISELSDSRCIYVASQKKFVRPGQLYWTQQQLGEYAYTIPEGYRSFRPFFDAIGVKDEPDGHDFVNILLEIVGKYFEQSKPLVGSDYKIYDKCLASIASIYEDDELKESDLVHLQENPSILNLHDQLIYPDEALLQDSEWYMGFFDGELDQKLYKPSHEVESFVEKGMKVGRLSESTAIILELVDGPMDEEKSVAEKLIDRIEIINRLLHDKPISARTAVWKTLPYLKVISYLAVQIKASVLIDGDEVYAPPKPTQAFYDINDNQLVLTRPINDRSWKPILNALFHQLIPSESGNEISKLTLILSSLMEMTVKEAHQNLDDAHFPPLDTHAEFGQADDLISPVLDEMGSEIEQANRNEGSQHSIPDSDSDGVDEISTDDDRNQRGDGSSQPEMELLRQPSNRAISSGSRLDSGKQHRPATGTDGDDSATESRHPKRLTRPEYKRQWDRRLLSYVRHKQAEISNDDERGSLSEHNLAIEAVAREAVCDYEKIRGRLADQKGQTNPGYDIISHNPLTGEIRFIEVKGIKGKWGEMGVGLSRLQFSNAQDKGDQYWLYVVEFTLDPKRRHVHAVQKPAMQVTAFMFDGNWREAATVERIDPKARFIPGVRIHHHSMGYGRILDVATHGNSRMLTVDFEDKPQATPNIELNLNNIRIAEDADDDNDSQAD